jgi:hypothetical protein
MTEVGRKDMSISSTDRRYRLCPECGAWFKPSKYCGSYARGISKYCGPDCRRAAVSRRDKERWQRKQRKAHDRAAAGMRGIGEERGADAPDTASPNGTGQGLSERRIVELAEWYADRAYWHYSPAAIGAGELDAELREILRREAPDRVEVEFERVTRAVRR